MYNHWPGHLWSRISAVLAILVRSANGVSMTTLPDLLYVALFAVALPLWDYLVSWPAFRRRSQADPARARMRLWRSAIAFAWPLVAVGAALWVWNDRSWTSFGFSVPDGWRLWTSIALVLLLAAYYAYAVATVARSSEQRASVRQQFPPGLTAVLPHTRTEMYWFGGVSLTAGFCEEFLFRGYFIWALAPWLGWWGAAASVPSDLRERACLPGMEWRPPHGNRRRDLHAGRGDLQTPFGRRSRCTPSSISATE